ncbi:hypothetical protein HU200_042747 [Digitaria exilis]|uniref:Uncharacterized protein n=1 Tax=Digitaria exilis TaxID=1010633 RepID=A0A835EEM8_9POAL|nr:hypothetical protein HU200_042747 [Digitaria exilis]
MACSPEAAKFTVRRQPAVLVAPAGPTPRELKRLSDLDDQDTLWLQISSIQFYRSKRGNKDDPVEVIRDALSKALVHYYPFAGRLREHDDGRKLTVDCTAEGVLFVEADADVPLEHFGDALLPPFPCLEELIFDVPGSSDILNTPLLLFQVTRLTCGGFILCVRLNHTMADAQGMAQFLGAVAELARGALAPSVPPVWERHLLEARNNPPPHAPALLHDNSSSIMVSLHDREQLRHRSFFFGPKEIAAIRAELSPELQKRATKFDTIAGWLWKFRTVALAPDDSNEVMPLAIIVNARGRRSSIVIPAGYYGNAFVAPVATSTAGEICENPLSYTVELVNKAKDEVDMEYVRSMADLIVLRGRKTPLPTAPGTYYLSDVTRARFEDHDFGWGRPVYGGPAEGVGSQSFPWVLSFVLPFKNANGEDGVVVPVCLPGPAMDRLVEEMGKLRLQPPVDETTLR